MAIGEIDAEPIDVQERNTRDMSNVQQDRSEFHSSEPRKSPQSASSYPESSEVSCNDHIDTITDRTSGTSNLSINVDITTSLPCKQKESLESPGNGSLVDPELLVESIEASSAPRPNWISKLRALQGCRLGMFFAILAAFSVCLMNIIITAWAMRRYSIDPETKLGTIYQGNCEITKRLSLWLHAIINVLSTVLLAASNYTMQCLLSPTRKDIDAAHKEGLWLDIGVPISSKNFNRLSKFQKLLWIILWLSSMPLHLLYNSSIFATTYTHNYEVSVVSETIMLAPPPLPSPFDLESLYMSYNNSNVPLLGLYQVHVSRMNDSWHTFTNPMDCLRAYTNRFPSRYGNVILVTKDVNDTVYNNFEVDVENGATSWLGCPLAATTNFYYPYSQGCDVDLEPKEHLSRGNWSFGGLTVKECRAQKKQEKCTLQYSAIILVSVILCNVAKTIAMMLTFIVVNRKSSPLVTIGDAIQSFLRDPDRWTRGLCYADRRVFHPVRNTREYPWNSERLQPQRWENKRARWASSVGAGPWTLLICSFLVIFVVAGVLLRISFTAGKIHGSIDARDIWERGFGQLYADSLIRPSGNTSNFYVSVILANTLQVVLSLLYLMYNSIFTVMIMGEEWCRFGSITKKTLRVTQPTGAQRSTYWLHLPYKFAIPLMSLSGLLHWSISQTLFFVQITIVDSSRGLRTDLNDLAIQSIVGYSILGGLVSVGIGILMLIVMGIVSLRRYPNSMPAIGSCSAAISAACHSNIPDRETREKVVLQPLSWGDVGLVGDDPVRDSFFNAEVRHLTFSAGVVNKPIFSAFYAGYSDGNALH